MTLTLTSCMGVGMVLFKILDQYLSSYQTWAKSIIGFENNEVLKTLTQNFNTEVLSPCLDHKAMYGGGDGSV